MNCSQNMYYLMEQLDSFEKAVVSFSQEHADSQTSESGELAIGSDELIIHSVYQNFALYEAPLRMRYLQTTQLYTIFEQFSFEFAKNISKEYSYISIDKLKGSRTYTAIQIYYTDVCNIEFKHWGKVDILRRVRNLISHSDGYIEFSEQKNKILNLANNNHELTILQNGRLAMTKKFLIDSFKAVNEFFDLVELKANGNIDTMFTFDYKIINEFRQFDTLKL